MTAPARRSLREVWRILRGAVPPTDDAVPDAWSGVLPRRCRWSGEVRLRGDVVVPWGGVLEIAAGTRVRAAPEAVWKYAYDRPGDGGQRFSQSPDRCSVVVWGELRALGTSDKPVTFAPEGAVWGGVVLLGAGRAEMAHATLSRADRAGVSCYDRARLILVGGRVAESPAGVLLGGLARLSATDALFEKNEVGVIAFDWAAVEAGGARFVGNGRGLRADDRARVSLHGASFRGNRRAGLHARGRAAVAASDGGFEGHAEVAAYFQDRSRGRFRNNRFFHNGYGLQAHDESDVRLEDDKIGPSGRNGLFADRRARMDLRRVFAHSHAREAAVQGQDAARLTMTDCKGFGNHVTLALHGRASALVQGTRFQGNAGAAVTAGGRARVDLRGARLLNNAAGVVLVDDAEGSAVASDFTGHDGPAVRVWGRAGLAARDCRFEENFVGLEAQDEARAVLERSRVARHAGHGVLARHSARVEAARCLFLDNARSAVQGLDRAVVTLANNEFLVNAVGAGFQGTSAGVLVDNVFQAQRQEGASLSGAGEVRVTGNVFARNAVGVGHFGRDRSRVRRNRFWGQTRTAGLCADEAAPLWERNLCADNRRGLECRDASAPTVVANRFEHSTGVALVVAERASPRLERNVFARNRAAWTAPAGVLPALRGDRFQENQTETEPWTES